MYDGRSKQAIDEFRRLVRARRYDEAFNVYPVIWRTLYWNRGRGREALTLLEMLYVNGTDQLPVLSNNADKATAENMAGILLSGFGDSRTAVKKFENYAHLSNCMPSRAQALVNKGDDLWRLGEILRAAATFDEAIQIYQRLHWPGKLALAYTDKARICIWISNSEGAMTYLKVARDLLRTSSGSISMSEQVLLEGKINDYEVSLLVFGKKFQRAQRLAQDWWEEVKNIKDASFDTQTSAFFWAMNTRIRLFEFEQRNLINSRLSSGIGESLLKCFSRSLKGGARYQQASIRLATARYLKLIGAYAKASREALLSLEISRPSAWVHLQADCHLFLASLHKEQGNIDVAYGHATRARELSRCDGPEYCYRPVNMEADALIRTLT